MRFVLVPGLLDETARNKGPDHAIDVHAPDRADPPSRDRLPVGDHGEGLERGLGEPRLLAVEHPALDEGRAFGPRVVAPSAGDLA
ncbi:unannotated protein [freshwater metagenome]|uniref:Unannotated protein n=1 Tax=freshwater metagenome TaxID=449393 RepID=A0A6J7LY13_9ZZZZ